MKREKKKERKKKKKKKKRTKSSYRGSEVLICLHVEHVSTASVGGSIRESELSAGTESPNKGVN